MNKVNFPIVTDELWIKAKKVVDSCKTKDHNKVAKEYLKSVQRTLYIKNKRLNGDGGWSSNLLIKYEIENYMNELYKRVR